VEIEYIGAICHGAHLAVESGVRGLQVPALRLLSKPFNNLPRKYRGRTIGRGRSRRRIGNMTEDKMQDSFVAFNSCYFGGQLNCKVVVTDDWIDADGNYYPDSAVKLDGESLMSGTAAGASVHRATALYNHSKDSISIPRWMLAGEKAPRALLLHEMAHSAANEPETDHGPKWHREMHRLWKAQAPINLHDVTPGSTSHELVTKHGVGSEFWERL
jgi:hypothetical protein